MYKIGKINSKTTMPIRKQVKPKTPIILDGHQQKAQRPDKPEKLPQFRQKCLKVIYIVCIICSYIFNKLYLTAATLKATSLPFIFTPRSLVFSSKRKASPIQLLCAIDP